MRVKRGVPVVASKRSQKLYYPMVSLEVIDVKCKSSIRWQCEICAQILQFDNSSFCHDLTPGLLPPHSQRNHLPEDCKPQIPIFLQDWRSSLACDAYFVAITHFYLTPLSWDPLRSKQWVAKEGQSLVKTRVK